VIASQVLSTTLIATLMFEFFEHSSLRVGMSAFKAAGLAETLNSHGYPSAARTLAMNRSCCFGALIKGKHWTNFFIP
jgi:hypothetical protein